MAGSVSKNERSYSDGNFDQRVSNFITFFNTIDHFLGVIDFNGIFIDVNRAGLELLGYSNDELRGKDAEIIFRDEDKKEIIEKYQTVKEIGAGEWTYTVISKNGLHIPTSLTFHKGVWDNEDAFFVVGKSVSADLMISEARNVSLRIVSSDFRGNIDSIINLALNETIRLTGSGIGFFGGFNKELSEIRDTIWISNDDSIKAEVFPAKLSMENNPEWKEAISVGKPIVLDHRQINDIKHGEARLKNGMVVPLLEDSEVKYILGLGNKSVDYNELDVNLISILWDTVKTEIKRIRTKNSLIASEFEYKNLFDSTRDALLLYDLSTVSIVLCNNVAVEMFGFKDNDELLKCSPLELSAEFQPDGSRSIEALTRNPIRALHESVNIPTWTHVRKNGEEFPSEVTLTSINYKGNAIVMANVRDISDKVKVESDLKRSKENFEIAVKEGGLGIFDYDVETQKLTVGQGYLDIIGYGSTKTSFTSEEWHSIMHPDDVKMVRRGFEAHIKGEGSEYRHEYRVKVPEGKFKWVQVSAKGVERDDDGRPRRIVGVMIDIDSIKKLSRQVEDTRNFLETIISSIEAILFVKDAEGRYLLGNRSFIDKFGLKGKEILGKTSEELNIPLDFDSSLTDAIVIQQGVDQTYEQELRLRDGKLYNYLITKIPIRDNDSKVYAQVGLATDITHIKELEKELRNNVFSLDAAINGTGNGLWDWNPKTDDFSVNDNWFGMLGYTRSQFNKKYRKFRFQVFSDHVHADDLMKVNEELEKHYAGTTDYYRIEIRMLTSDNEWKWILSSGKVWEWDEDNKPIRMVGIHVDIDYKVRVEEQLKQALIKAEESDRLKSAFLANMSHEIRTPMNGIIGFLDLLNSEEIPSDQRNEYMSIIRNSSNQLLDIVNDIVDTSKIEAGQVTIRNSTFDIQKLFEDLKMQYGPALNNKNLSFVIECDLEGTKSNIISDQTKLRQVLSNLISNAIKFTIQGGIVLGCKRDGANIIFSVEDTGPGIPKELHDKVFERFIQAEMGLTRLKEGTGLGLSICKAYVEKLGGRIWIEPDKSEGSKFCFSIPHIVDPTVTVIPKQDPVLDDNKEGVILIIEDEIYNYLFVEQILQNRGMRVLHAENGTSALELVSKHPEIGLIFMDIRLPGMDGYEITREIKQKFPSMPVIALTALALSGDREKALEAGCDDYLKKPVLRDELLNAVDKVFVK